MPAGDHREAEYFENAQLDKVMNAIEAIKTAEKRSEFESILSSLNATQQKDIAPVIKKRMAELKELANAT